MTDQNPTQPREWNSTEYHRLSQPQASWGRKVLSRLKLNGDEFVMDAGCGTGRLTEDLLNCLPRGRVVGVDLSLNMLQTARGNLAKFGKRVEFVAADLARLPFADAFDGIFSTAAFHWVVDHEQLFRSLRVALRPEGWLHAQCGGGPNLARLRQRVAGLISHGEYKRFFEGFAEPWEYSDAETAADRLRAASFIDVETSLEPALTVLSDAQTYSDFVSSVILRQHLQLIPEEGLQGQLMRELTAAASKDDPPYSLDYWRLNLNAKVPA